MDSQDALSVDTLPRSASASRITVAGCKSKASHSTVELRQDINANEKHWRLGGDMKGEKEEETTTQLRPPDGGWGWLVALGSFVISTLLPMIGPCFGVLFSRYLLEQGASSTTTAWIFNTECCIWNVMGIVTRPLTKEFGWRRVGIFGAALASVAFVASAFAPSPEFLFFSFSLLVGVGGGMVVSVCFMIVPLYFDRKRGVATAIMMAGICLGQILGPPVARFLQDEYGFRGATMIVGAIVLHGCLGASFFHPVEWHLKKSQVQVVSQPPQGETLLISHRQTKLGSIRRLVNSRSEVSFDDSIDEGEFDLMRSAIRARMMRVSDDRHMSEASSISRNNSSLCISSLDIAGIAAMPDADQGDVGNLDGEDPQRSSSSICSIMLRVVRSTVSDLGILRSPRAAIIALSGTCCINGYLNFMMIVPFAMQAAGQTLDASAWCISISAVCNLLCRMIVSSLSDWKRFNMRVCYVVGYSIIFFSIFIFPFLTDLPWLMATMALFGCGVGSNMGLYTLVMIDVMGLDNLAPTFGASCFLVAMGFICLGPLIGFIRDASNSYALSMWVLSALLLTSFILFLFMPAAVRYDERRGREKEEEEKNKP